MKSITIILIVVVCSSVAVLGVLAGLGITTDQTNQPSIQQETTLTSQERADQRLEEKKKEIGWDTGTTSNEPYFTEIEEQEIQRGYELELQEIQDEAERQQRLQQEELLRLEKIQNDLMEQNQIDEVKTAIILQAKELPLLQGIINGGELSFWFEDLPPETSNNVKKSVNGLISQLDGFRIHGVTLKQTYSENSADFTINWTQEYSSNHIGRQIGDHLIIGLGSSDCGSWKPFDAVTVYSIVYHEIGHALGQGHSDNSNNIMYYKTDTKYENDYKGMIRINDGDPEIIPFCNGGKIHFTTEKADSSSASYEVYVIDSGGDKYNACSGESGQSYNKFSNSCNVEIGSSLVLFNPSTFGAGEDARINIEIKNINDYKNTNLNFETSSGYFTQDQLNNIRELFDNL